MCFVIVCHPIQPENNYGLHQSKNIRNSIIMYRISSFAKNIFWEMKFGNTEREQHYCQMQHQQCFPQCESNLHDLCAISWFIFPEIYVVFNIYLYRADTSIEYLEEDAAYLEGLPRLMASNSQDETQSCDENSVFDLTQYGSLDNVDHTHDSTVNEKCNGCLQLELQLQKSQIVISKLQKRCCDKSAEIKRLRVSEKRSKMAKKSLEELLSEIKENKWISEVGQDVINVN